jgi:chaperonin GroES
MLEPERIHPVGDRVLILKDERSQVTPRGVWLGGRNQPRPVLGTVLAVGPGRIDTETGQRLQIPLRKGDRVLFPSWAATTEAVDPKVQHLFRPGILSDRLMLIRSCEIHGKVTEE